MKFLQGLRFVILKYNEDLHAKCYLNDDKMIITSLNLYEFSMANNKEMGVIIDKNDPADTQVFEDALKEVDFIIQTSQSFELIAPKPNYSHQTENRSKPEKSNSSQSYGSHGYCIRSGVSIPFNIEKPLSYESFKKWAEYGDVDYPEKFCHFSGEKSNGETSVSKPILKKNWKAAKEIFVL
jgi:phosphatidylserine/phosphatidylglycerophosphate/cardiolipin synthase-like enzyme